MSAAEDGLDSAGAASAQLEADRVRCEGVKAFKMAQSFCGTPTRAEAVAVNAAAGVETVTAFPTRPYAR